MNQINKLNINTTERWIITFTVMLVTIIEVLDMTIVNVSLPTMTGELGATSDQITWVLTSYIVASAIMMPLTGFLVTSFGRKKVLITSIIGFLIASMLCGLSASLGEIVFFRTLQGVFGALLVPLSQCILNDIFPKEEQGKAMAIWGIGIMIAPVLGPTLGGYITDALSWRWIFYMNLPVCLISLVLAWGFIKETATKRLNIDWLGLSLMAIAIGCLQIFLDRGNSSDWFHSKFIVIVCLIWIFALIAFVIRGIGKPDNIINFSLFKNRNFTAATIMLAVFGVGIFGIIAVMPLMLEHLMGYSSELAGLLMLPRGIAAAVGMAMAAILMKRIDTRWAIFAGIVASAYGSYLMCQFNLQTSFAAMVWPSVVLGFGTGLFFVPLSTAALTSLSEKDAAEGAGLFNFARNLGGSIGISLLSTLITREAQINWNRLAGHGYLTNYHFRHWLQIKHLIATSPLAISQLIAVIAKQSSMIAFLDSYWAVTISFVAMLPLILLMRKIKGQDNKMFI